MVDAVRLSGRYTLRERIAVGGMGAVYAATDERLGRSVAVKVLKRDLAGDPRFVERFRREARAVASLSHPNMVSVYDYGEDDDHSYIVMELVEGRDLARVLRDDGRLDPERVRSVGAQVCAALAHAHAAGIVHRDVKPGNVIVTPDDRAKVADFGIARAVGDATLTATGSVMGTAHYLSPEQAAGRPVTPASDLYSLGIVLYELLTGAVPFEGDTPIAIAMRHVSEEVPRVRATRAEVSPEIDDAIATATAKDPSERFAHADDMAAALEGRAARAAVLGANAPTALAAGAPTAVDTGAPTAVAAGAPTAVDTAGAPANGELADEGWAPQARRDPAAVGRRVVLVLAALVALAVVVLAAQLLTSDDGDDAATRARGGGGEESPARAQLNESIIGRSYQDVEAELKEEGYAVGREDVDSDAPVDTVVDSDPPPGSTLTPGQLVTLVVSKGPPEDEPEPAPEEPEETPAETPAETPPAEDDGGPDPPGEAKGLEKKLDKDLDKKLDDEDDE